MIADIKCPHCRTVQTIDTHWIKKQTDRIRCIKCGNDYPVTLWSWGGKSDVQNIKEVVIFT
jgi:predicted Zn finger-like uncharacterized protein